MPSSNRAVAAAIALAALVAAAPVQATAAPDYATLVEPVDALEREAAELRARLEADPDNRDARLRLARIHGLMGDHERGLPEVDRLLAATPDDPGLLALRFDLLSRRIDDSSLFGRKRAAEALLSACEEAHRRDPRHVDAVQCLISYLAKAPRAVGGDPERARALAGGLEALDATAFHLHRGGEAREAGDNDAAGKHYAAALETAAALEDVLTVLYFRMGRKDWAGAREALARAATVAPDAPIVLYQTGVVAAESGEGQADGRAALVRFLAGPTWWDGYDLRAAGHWWIGTICESLGERDVAKQAYRRTLALDPGHEGAKESLKRLN